MKPLHHSTSNIEVRSDLLHLAAMELEAMSISSSSSSSSSSNNASRGHFDPYASSPSPSSSSSASNDYSSNNKTEGTSLNTASDNTMSTTTTSTTQTAAAAAATTSNEEPVIIEIERPFPPGCLHLLYSLPSNSSCHDCHSHPAHWASISYGITLCLQCSGKHRSLGVRTSVVKSLQLDSWKRREVLCMLEGGNEQLTRFFDRHEMGSRSSINSSGSSSSTGRRRQEDGEQQRRRGLLNGSTDSPTTTTKTMEMKYYDDNASSWVLDRYKTKAASFYRQHLMGHATRLSNEGVYGGREASRGSGRGTRDGGGARRESSRLAD